MTTTSITMARLTRSLAWALAALPSVAVLAADLRMPSSSSSSSSSLLLRPAPRHLQASTRGAPDNTQPVGTNPVKIASAQRLGYQVANNSCSHRDLGFAGRLGAHWYAVYGDTLWCAQGVKDPESDQDSFHGMARDAVSLLTDDPLVVMDLHLNQDQPVPHQSQFVPFRADWNETNTHGFGGTSLCEVDSETGTGVLFYLIVRGPYPFPPVWLWRKGELTKACFPERAGGRRQHRRADGRRRGQGRAR